MSGPRFATYVNLAGGDRDRAVELYHWTGDIAGGLMADFRVLEVLLRNRIDQTMSEHVGGGGVVRGSFVGRDRRLHLLPEG